MVVCCVSAMSQTTMPSSYPHKKWTVGECRALVENGILDPVKYELIEGDIVVKAGRSQRHAYVVMRLVAQFDTVFGIRRLQTKAPIGIGATDDSCSDPEPDVAVLRGTTAAYLETQPNPSVDVLLAVQVAESTVEGDTTVKARLYAGAGVPEYWVVSIPDRTVIVFRQPSLEGYAPPITLTENDTVHGNSGCQPSALRRFSG
jgi:Uma2 family endonuclease